MNHIDVMKQALHALEWILNGGAHPALEYSAIENLRKAIEETEKCQCSLSTKLVGSGCRYCNPQEYIDILEEQIAEAEKVGPINIDWLSNVIRAVDGNNTLGAGELAEKIVAHILLIRGTPQREWDGRLTDDELPELKAIHDVIMCIGCVKEAPASDPYTLRAVKQMALRINILEAKLKEKNA